MLKRRRRGFKNWKIHSRNFKLLLMSREEVYFGWIGDEPLCRFLNRNINLTDLHHRVCEYWFLGEGWDWNRLMGFLPLYVENNLTAFVLCEEESPDNELCWGMVISWTFLVTFAYDIVEKNEVLTNEFIWKQIWKLHVPN